LDLNPDVVRASIRSIIVSIKPLEDGFEEIADDAPLFSDGSGRPSPVNLDSLDALDLAMSVGDEFNLDNEEFERLVESDEGLERLRTVNDITDLILSLVKNGGVRADAGDNLRGKEVTA
jgi:acyl carrier protein